MKKILILAAVAFGVMSAQAQVATVGSACSNWQVGIDGGATTPLQGTHFLKNARGAFGIHIDKMVSPVVGLGVEGLFTVNTSKWDMNGGESNGLAIDNSYVGGYAKFNLMNLFCGYKCEQRFFDIEAVLGAGWLRSYEKYGEDYYLNDFGTKVGMNFNFNVTKNLTLALKPSVSWNMTSDGVEHANASYDRHRGQFNLLASVSYTFNPGFECVVPRDQAEIDGLNAEINALRGALAACEGNVAALTAQNADLANQLAECNARKAVVKEVTNNNYSSVRFVFYKIGSSKIGADQQPNVEMIAAYLKSHPESKVVIKGYASQDGPKELNEKLAAARAESVKTALINKYKIDADRIVAEGEGIGHMFEEESWNRVSICELEAK